MDTKYSTIGTELIETLTSKYTVEELGIFLKDMKPLECAKYLKTHENIKNLAPEQVGLIINKVDKELSKDIISYNTHQTSIFKN